jgi:ribonuclease P protein component
LGFIQTTICQDYIPAYMNMSYAFERTRRIVKTDEFSSVFRLRPLFKTDHLVLYAQPNSLPHARLGVVAARRLAPRAVTRNAVKRAVREGFRQSDLVRSLGLDCVVRLSKPVGNKQQPACTAAMQALLFREVLSLFAISSRFQKVLDASIKGVQ